MSPIWIPDTMNVEKGAYFKSRLQKGKLVFSGVLFAGFIVMDFIGFVASLVT